MLNIHSLLIQNTQCITSCGHNLYKLLFTNKIIFRKLVVYTLRENVMMIQCLSAYFH